MLRRIVRMAVLFRCPPRDVASWSAAEMDLVEAFLSKEPAPDQRVEIAVARLCELFASAWGKPGSTPPTVMTFLPFHGVWNKPTPGDARYSDLDREALAAFGVK